MGDINISNVDRSTIALYSNGPVNQTVGNSPTATGPQRNNAAPPSARPEGPSSHPDQPAEADTLSDEEIDELARMYPSPQSATLLLRRSGFPLARLPLFEVNATPYEFWSEVSQRVRNGLVDRGRQRLLATACNDNPYNRVFRSGTGEVNE